MKSSSDCLTIYDTIHEMTLDASEHELVILI
jgi:hypothetical protein